MKCMPICILLFMLIAAGNTLIYAAPSVTLEMPPVSLEKWYKPVNKRQVWLHTMFKLRREMQAISEYALQKDLPAMEKWLSRLQKDYNKIAEMVPEWQGKIKPDLLDDLKLLIVKADFINITAKLNTIQRSCDDCHSQFQPLVTALYRSPDYDDVQLSDVSGAPQKFDDSMDDLSISINRILIALEDGYASAALQASKMLAAQLHNLGESCNHCHIKDDYPRERILGMATRERLDKLQSNINTGQVKDSQMLMGEIAVTVCARCHNVHRVIYDLRNTLLSDK